ncbi:hypothetical protein Fleli_3789 [Bernardetia litoralis DSM 6794]|uniref:Uncharacterized protein n=1 Tax=Bernardetia litoralis (strain ATCC 23117 / DSM 6794 / NBRC 15988 / NCIMB 1366 / Fx l1 / Sio-4) TaxID=880071 RepID=I4AQ64_BERLS|nr:hypothetical protein [Bernardetia litoralis]AFM06099.1 hypothetical protein Fleli_3789 [Bernardetia litoralis DSM 6794]
MFYLSKEQIIKINEIQVKKFGGNFVPPQNFLKESSLDYLLEIIDANQGLKTRFCAFFYNKTKQ